MPTTFHFPIDNVPADPINVPILAMGSRAAAGPSLLVSVVPPSGITFPFYFTVVRGGVAIVVLEATNWVSTTISISGAAPNWTDVDVHVGDHIEIRVTAEAFSEIHTAVQTLEKSQYPWKQFTVVGGAFTINWSQSNKWYGTLDNGANTPTYTGVPAAGTAEILTLRLTQPGSGAAGTMSWPAGSKYPAGTPPVLSTANNAVDYVAVYLDPTAARYETTLIGNAYA